jgi:hypothetical protein
LTYEAKPQTGKPYAGILANGTVLPVITQVALNDFILYFDYTNSLQVSVIRNYFETERNSTTFTYETPAGDALVCSTVVFLHRTGPALTVCPARLSRSTAWPVTVPAS